MKDRTRIDIHGLEHLLSLPKEVKPGTFISLHISNNYYYNDLFLNQLADYYRCQSFSVSVASYPRAPKGIKKLFYPRKSSKWLAQRAHIPLSKAEDIINNLPTQNKVPLFISTCIGGIAGNPRTILGVVAALQQNADILIYSSGCMDPYGVESLQNFLIDENDNRFIAIEVTSMFGINESENALNMIVKKFG